MEQVKVEMVGREVIKPASPSPQDHIQLSSLDVSLPGMYVSAVFFYKAEDLVTISPEITSGKLKGSLSKTLSRFYPLAGRIEGVSISCNDEGATFEEARTNVLLHDFLRNNKTNLDSLVDFAPTMEPGYSAVEWPLLCVKVTYFGSGSGVAVSICLSHRICDAATLMTFLKDWSTTTTNDDAALSTPTFAETTIFPPPPPLTHSSTQSASMDPILDFKRRCVMNRFVFESSKIAELKREAASERVQVPTRVESITSLIWRCARNASTSNLGVQRSTTIFQAVDLRLRLPSTILPPDAVGNLQSMLFLKESAERELKLRETVAAFRTAKERISEMIKENLQKNTLGESLLNENGKLVSEFKLDIDIFFTSSWCGKPFYEVDFGWGTPALMGPVIPTISDMVYVLLIDSKDGKGVEAWISLPEQDMPVFIHDQELIPYAVVNPPVLI